MRLSEKLRQGGSARQQSQQQADQQSGLPPGSIRGVALSYSQIVTAIYLPDNTTTTLLGSADIVGMSQCEKFVPHGGENTGPDWAPSDDFRVIAINGVPVGQQAAAEFAGTRNDRTPTYTNR